MTQLILQKSPHDSKIMLGTVILFIAILFGFIAVIIFVPIKGDLTIWQKIGEESVSLIILLPVLMFILLIPMLVYQSLYKFRERLIVDDKGIHYHSNIPTKLQGIAFINSHNIPLHEKDWSFSWDKIEAAYITKRLSNIDSGSTLITLELKVGSQRQEILLCQWTNTKNPIKTPCLNPNSLPWLQDGKCEERLLQMPIMQAVAEHNIPIEVEPAISLSIPFYATINRYMLTAVSLFILLTTLPSLSTFINFQERYLAFPFMKVNLMIAIVIGLLFSLWMIRAKIPTIHSIFTGLVMIGGSLFIAASPALLWVNYLTDIGGLTNYQYKLQNIADETVNFVPLNDYLPNVELSLSEYWEQFSNGSIHNFELRKGGLGFYQINMQPIEEKISEYEEERSVAE